MEKEISRRMENGSWWRLNRSTTVIGDVIIRIPKNLQGF